MVTVQVQCSKLKRKQRDQRISGEEDREHILHFQAVPLGITHRVQGQGIASAATLSSIEIRDWQAGFPQGRPRDEGEQCILLGRPLSHCLSPSRTARVEENTFLSECGFSLFLFGEGLSSFIFSEFIAERPRLNSNAEKCPRTVL